MKQFIRVLLPTGHLYEIPAQAIAENRAAYYHQAMADEFPTLDAALQDSIALFEDNTEIREWALNNMNVEELMKPARLVRYTQPEQDFAGGDWSFEDAGAIIPQLESQSMLAMPLEMALAAMAAHRNLCQVLTINSADGQPQAAVVVIQGGPAIVGTYVGALTHLTQAYVAPPAGVTQQ